MVSPSAKRSEVIMMYKVLLPDCKHFLLGDFMEDLGNAVREGPYASS